MELKKLIKRYTFLGLTFLLFVAFTSGTVFGLYETTIPWSMYRHDLTHSGSTTSTAPSTNDTLWSWSHTGLKTPVVADGKVIVADNYGLYALDETTGVKLWGPSSFTGSFYGAPTVVDGRIYMGTSSGYLYCVNATNGAKIWEYQATATGQIQTNTAVANGKVYFGTTDNYLYALNANTGAHVWHYVAGGAIYYSSPAVDGTMIYFGCDDDKVYALNDTGSLPALRWTYTTLGNVRSTPTIADGKIFFGSSSTDHALFAVDKTTGGHLWKYVLSTSYTIDTSPAFSDGIVYFTAPYNKAYALYANATVGINYTETDPAIRLWSTTVGTYPNSPAVADGKVFFGAGYALYALNAADGITLWTYTFTYTIDEPIVADGRIFVSQYYGLYCFGNPYPPVTYYYTVTPIPENTFIIRLDTNGTPSSQLGVAGLITLKKINYTIEGIVGTTGMSNITIPNAMLGGPYTVTVDGGVPTYQAPPVDNGTHTSLYFTYLQSSHMVEITGTTVIAEFPSPTIILPVLITASLIAVALAKNRKNI